MPEKLYRVVSQRSNPKSREYMITLLNQKFPDAELVEVSQLYSNDKIILLYPDSIGLGWKKIEANLMQKFQVITVLTGRKRLFDLNSTVHRRLLFRRFIEVTFLPEILFMPFLLFYGILITLKDKISSCKS